MTTIVNTPPSSNNSSGPWGMIIGVIVLIALGYLVVVYGIPAIQRIGTTAPQINVPSKIDINVNQAK